MHYRIGTRGSKLALVQSEYVKRRMEEAYPEDTFELVILRQQATRLQIKPLAAIGTKGLFCKARLRKNFFSGSIDMAVHSMKDMPAECETGLTFAKGVETRGLQRCTYIKDCRKFFRTSFGCGYRYWEPQACMPACNAAS